MTPQDKLQNLKTVLKALQTPTPTRFFNSEAAKEEVRAALAGQALGTETLIFCIEAAIRQLELQEGQNEINYALEQFRRTDLCSND